MAIKIRFDSNHNAQLPTFVLMSKGGRKLGAMPATNVQFQDVFNGASNARFDVYKADCSDSFWKRINDLKLVWAKEWNAVFELTLDKHDVKTELHKSCTMQSLGESELSQIKVYNLGINTEDDIARDDYSPTVIFNEQDSKASLLDRLLEKAPHYSIKHVDSTIANIQRTFEWDDTPIYDALLEVSEEIGALVVLDCYLDDNMELKRELSLYDLESYCYECGERGEFFNVCEHCGSTNIKHGYGEDTTILVTSENLADEIELTTDTGSVKNCMKLEAGDDLMTATIAGCNPNGSSYIWHITDETKEDMSPELVSKLNEYDALYNEYQTTHGYSFSDHSALLSDYNNLVDKYSAYTTDYPKITSPIVGYPALTEANYEVIDFYYYLSHSLMPSVEMSSTNASAEAQRLANNLSSVYSNKIGVRTSQDLSILSVTTANSTVLQFAKSIIKPSHKVSIEGTPTLSNSKVWNGTVRVTNYSDEEDTATVTLQITFSSDYEKYVKQSIDRVLSEQNSDDVVGISELFKLNNTGFANELKKYSQKCLQGIYDACQACVDVLIKQGVADGVTWYDTLYDELYINGYYAKSQLIASELALRDSEVECVKEMMSVISNFRSQTHEALDFEGYLGETLWLEFVSYRREDTYRNDNYISDGLDDAELFDNAWKFFKEAKKELFKSAELQHSITATLKNLLVMAEFAPIVNYFKVGNWIRVKIDGEIYRLRLLSYEINFSSPENLSVTFSDVTHISNSITDIQSVLAQASSMASSYESVKRQADKGGKGYDQQTGWVADGLSLTNVKIVSSAQNQDVVMDDKGILCREYLPITDDYDPAQLKIINQGLYVTDDNWATARAGIGKFNLWNPITQQEEERYGVIADTVAARIILSENVYVANEGNTFSVTESDGLKISKGNYSVKINPNATYLLDVTNDSTHLMYLDNNGNLNITGKINASSGSITGGMTVSGYLTTNANRTTYNSTSAAGITIDKNGIGGYGSANAYFNMTTGGALTAVGATITGSITATSGYIGTSSNGFTIDSYGFYSGSKTSNSNGYLTISNTDFTRTINGTSRGSLRIALGSGFGVTNAGKLYAGSAVISGDITATSGYIGTSSNGFTIDSYGFYSGSKTGTSNGYLTISNTDFTRSINGTSRSGLRIALGSYFGVTNSGKLYAGSADISGTVTATGGSIGGWGITSERIQKYSAEPTGTGTRYWVGLGAKASPSSGDWALLVQNIPYTNGTAGSAVTKFRLNYDGSFTANNATITGTINSDGGTIGGTNGWVITTNAIYRGTSSMSSTTQGTFIGINGIRNYYDSSHYINMQAGILTATGANISGVINSSSGKIGGWTLTSNQLYKEATVSGDKYLVRLYAPATPSSTDVAILVTGGTVTIDDNAWHYYGQWRWSDSSDWTVGGGGLTAEYFLEKDDGTVSSALSYSQAKAWCPTFPTVETRGDHSETLQSYTKILYNGALYSMDIYYNAMHNQSDRRLKTDIEYLDIESSSKFVYSLKPARFKYKINPNKLHHGLVAQEVESSMLYDDWCVVDEDYEGYKSLNYIEMISDLIATAQSQNNRITQLENLIEQLIQTKN